MFCDGVTDGLALYSLHTHTHKYPLTYTHSARLVHALFVCVEVT